MDCPKCDWRPTLFGSPADFHCKYVPELQTKVGRTLVTKPEHLKLTCPRCSWSTEIPTKERREKEKLGQIKEVL